METNRITPTLQNLARNRGETIAVANERGGISYQELATKVASIAKWLSSRNKPLVAYIALPGGPDFTTVQLGVMEAGCIAVPIPNKLTTTEAAKYFSSVPPDLLFVSSLADCKAIIEAMPADTMLVMSQQAGEQACLPTLSITLAEVIVDPQRAASPQESRTKIEPGVAMIQFTSGSTGWPKAILIDWANIAANQRMHSKHLERYAGTNVFCPIPQFHAMGNAVVMEQLLSGSSIYLANGFLHGEHLKCITTTGASAIQASPNYFRMLLRLDSFTPSLLPNLRFATIGSDWIDAGLISALRTRFPALSIFCRYGLSEAFGALSYNTIAPGKLMEKEGALGELLEDALLAPELKALQPGNPPQPLRVTSATAANCQLLPTGEKVSLKDKDGFLNTGDLVYGDAQGKLYIAGRESQFIKSNGYRINPFEVEEILRLLPEIHDAVVSGIPDPVAGQKVVACIINAVGVRSEINTLRAHCMKHLSTYKIPLHFLFGVEIPKTHSGKVARKQLAELLPALIKQSST